MLESRVLIVWDMRRRELTHLELRVIPVLLSRCITQVGAITLDRLQHQLLYSSFQLSVGDMERVVPTAPAPPMMFTPEAHFAPLGFFLNDCQCSLPQNLGSVSMGFYTSIASSSFFKV